MRLAYVNPYRFIGGNTLKSYSINHEWSMIMLIALAKSSLQSLLYKEILNNQTINVIRKSSSKNLFRGREESAHMWDTASWCYGVSVEGGREAERGRHSETHGHTDTQRDHIVTSEWILPVPILFTFNLF